MLFRGFSALGWHCNIQHCSPALRESRCRCGTVRPGETVCGAVLSKLYRALGRHGDGRALAEDAALQVGAMQHGKREMAVAKFTARLQEVCVRQGVPVGDLPWRTRCMLMAAQGTTPVTWGASG